MHFSRIRLKFQLIKSFSHFPNNSRNNLYAIESGVLITINETNESRGRIGVRDQCEFLRLGKQSRRLPVLKILRTRFNCTLLFVERVTASRGDLYLRKSSNREETCTFSHNEILFLENTFTCSDVHVALYYDQ